MAGMGLGLGVQRLAPPGYPGVPPSTGKQLRAGLVSMWELEGPKNQTDSTFIGANPIQIIRGQQKADSYPFTFIVSSLPGTIANIRLRLESLSCTINANSLQLLLVSPTGKKVILMSGACGNTIGANLINFDDAYPALPQNSSPSDGSYKPTTFGGVTDLLAPAPVGAYQTTMSAFNGDNPNGTWSLYLMTTQTFLLSMPTVYISSADLLVTTTTGLVTWPDSQGNNHLSAVGTPTKTTGKQGNGISLNGVSQYLTITDNATLRLGNSFTMAAWINPVPFGANPLQPVFYKGTAHTQDEYFMQLFGLGQIATQVVVQGALQYNQQDFGMTPSVWHYIAFGLDLGRNVYEIFYDGQFATFSPILPSTIPLPSTQPLRIGFDGEAQWFNGMIDEAALWSRLLSKSELLALYNNGSGRRFPWNDVNARLARQLQGDGEAYLTDNSGNHILLK